MTYLSVDIDYWCREENNTKLDAFLRKIRHKPISVFISHEEMIPDIEKSSVNKIINVDYHSDLADNCSNGDLPELNEGTWANHISFKGDGEFLWIYPVERCYYAQGEGRCDVDFSPFCKNSKEICGWKKASRRLNRLPTNKEIEESVKVGIAISPCWSTSEHMKYALEYLFLNKNIGRETYDELLKGIEK